MVPTGRPSAVARCACAASSTSARWCFAASASSGRMSAACPYKCTGRSARVRGVIAASTCRGSSVSRSGSTSVKTGRAPAIITASAEYAAESGGVITSSPGPMSSARRIRVIASVPVPTPTACGTRLAAANSVSNASTSGPSTNHPLAITRSIATRIAAASSPGVSALNGTRTGIVRQVLAVVLKRARESLAKFHGRRPSGSRSEQRRIRIEAADVDRFLLGRPLDEGVAAAAGQLDQQLHQLAMGDVLFAANVERFAIHRVGGARRQKRLDRVVDVNEIANLRAIAENLDLAVFERETHEPADESLAVVAQELTRAVDVGEAQRAGAHVKEVVVDEVV